MFNHIGDVGMGNLVVSSEDIIVIRWEYEVQSVEFERGCTKVGCGQWWRYVWSWSC